MILISLMWYNTNHIQDHTLPYFHWGVPLLPLFLTRKQTGMRFFTPNRTLVKGHHAAFYPIQSDWLGRMNSTDPDKQLSCAARTRRHHRKNEKRLSSCQPSTKEPCHLPAKCGWGDDAFQVTFPERKVWKVICIISRICM